MQQWYAEQLVPQIGDRFTREINSQAVNNYSNIIPGTHLDTLVNIVCGKRPLEEKNP